MFQQSRPKLFGKFLLGGQTFRLCFSLIWCLSYCSSWWFLILVPESSINSQQLVCAMKTDEILMTIVAAKLLGLFKNDQSKPKPIGYPIPVPIPRIPAPYTPPTGYGGGCNRPRKCRKSFPYTDHQINYGTLPEYIEEDAYDESYDSFPIEGGSYKNDLYHIGSEIPPSIDINSGYSNYQPFKTTAPHSGNDYIDLDAGTDTETHQHDQKSPEYYDQETEYAQQDESLEDEKEQQITSDTKEYKKIFPVAPKNKKRRKYFQSKLDSAKSKTKPKKKSKRNKNRTRKLRKQTSLESNSQTQVQYEYVTSTELSPPEIQQQVIRLGEKPSSSQQVNHPQTMDKGLAQEEINEQQIGKQSDEEQKEKNKATTIANSGYHQQQQQQQHFDKTVSSVQADNQISESSSNNEQVLKDSQDKSKKLIRVLPKTIRAYLDKFKLWNKPWKDSSQYVQTKLNQQQETITMMTVGELQQRPIAMSNSAATSGERNKNPNSHGWNFYPTPIHTKHATTAEMSMLPKHAAIPSTVPALIVDQNLDIIEEQHVLYPIMKKSAPENRKISR